MSTFWDSPTKVATLSQHHHLTYLTDLISDRYINGLSGIVSNDKCGVHAADLGE